MQARYYDPVIGRFYSNDPVDALGHLNTPNGIHGFNRYAYANNNPYKYTDPTGKISFPVLFSSTNPSSQGKQIAGQMQKNSQVASVRTAKTIMSATQTGGSVALTLTPGGAMTKLATATVSAGLLGAKSDTPVETFVTELASDLVGGMVGDKLNSIAKALPGIKGFTEQADTIVKDTLTALAGSETGKEIKEKAHEKLQEEK